MDCRAAIANMEGGHSSWICYFQEKKLMIEFDYFEDIEGELFQFDLNFDQELVISPPSHFNHTLNGCSQPLYYLETFVYRFDKILEYSEYIISAVAILLLFAGIKFNGMTCLEPLVGIQLTYNVLNFFNDATPLQLLRHLVYSLGYFPIFPKTNFHRLPQFAIRLGFDHTDMMELTFIPSLAVLFLGFYVAVYFLRYWRQKDQKFSNKDQ